MHLPALVNNYTTTPFAADSSIQPIADCSAGFDGKTSRPPPLISLRALQHPTALDQCFHFLRVTGLLHQGWPAESRLSRMSCPAQTSPKYTCTVRRLSHNTIFRIVHHETLTSMGRMDAGRDASALSRRRPTNSKNVVRFAHHISGS